MEELFTFEEDNIEFLLNLVLIADKQATDEHRTEALTKGQAKYTSAIREGIKLNVNHKTDTIYVPASLHASFLQWYHTTQQHPGIK
jgi:hypothetical protein